MAGKLRGRRKRRSRTESVEVTLYSRSVLCGLCGISEFELRQWEHEELLMPARFLETEGRVEPLYDASVFERVRMIRTLTEDLEVNLPGISVILRLLEQMGR